MKRIITGFSSILIVSTILFGACKKTKDEPSIGNLLAGKWKPSSGGHDANHNKAIDASEDIAFPDNSTSYIVFNHDGTGASFFATSDTTDTVTWFRWSVGNDNKEVTTIRTKGYSEFISLADTTTYQIAVLSATDLRLTIMTVGGELNWRNYKKQ